ncbi:MAG: hypothetical protein NUV80_00485 [Candidatus Berkelbacteria bacterium]|nr:hypothetical protein [Candidatus Berkelbacteria bacterium]MCR4307023.1 hypothetical protein [Candidatus Berkelbacteria bacterium]
MENEERPSDIAELANTLQSIDTSSPPPSENQVIGDNGEVINLNENPKNIVKK